jgi:D-glycero-D-manno-heptose 1,7-bisphosphate phosphatase
MNRNVKLNKIAFLDRDGVLNSSKFNNGYIGYKKYFRWIPGAIKTIKYLKRNNYKVVVVSNQSGVARGYFTMNDVKQLHFYMQKKLIFHSTKIDKYFFCPFHINGIVKKFKKKSPLRKPNIGMFKQAEKLWNIDKRKSFMIGDQNSDIKFSKKAGIKGYLFKEKNLYNFIKKIKIND